MQSFVQRFAGLILGVLSGFDRLRFRGTKRWLAHPKGLFGFLGQRGVLLKDFGTYAADTSQQVPVQKVLISNGVDLSAAEVVTLYDLRWQIELFFKELKSTLGFAQYRFRRFEAVEGWVQASLVTFCYLEWYRAGKLRRRGLSAAGKRWWSWQRSHGLCQAVRQEVEEADLGQLQRGVKTKAGIRRLRRLLRAARPLEEREVA